MRVRDAQLEVDMPLLAAIVLLSAMSLVVLYSASGESLSVLGGHGARILIAFILMFLVARVPTASLVQWSPYLYCVGLALLVSVLLVGITGKGAQRWLDLVVVRFQPAELMKVLVPMMVAWVITRAPLPPSRPVAFASILVILLPVGLVVAQPDLGTAIMISLAGITALFFAGIRWKVIFSLLVAGVIAAPFMWKLLLHDYQRTRIVTLFDPWADPLGAGYHTIQSVIAVGSGGVTGKGWLAGSQSQLEFIPEQRTDFIFSVFAEEFGLIGAMLLLGLYLFVGLRGLFIAYHASDSYSRLLGGCLSITFFCYVFINIGMASGLLPVVGVPLPLLSQGGSSMVTLMIGFGILMSINRRRSSIHQSA